MLFASFPFLNRRNGSSVSHFTFIRQNWLLSCEQQTRRNKDKFKGKVFKSITDICFKAKIRTRVFSIAPNITFRQTQPLHMAEDHDSMWSLSQWDNTDFLLSKLHFLIFQNVQVFAFKTEGSSQLICISKKQTTWSSRIYSLACVFNMCCWYISIWYTF